jgi:hypothetical protein
MRGPCKVEQLIVQTATASSVESNHFKADWAVDADPKSRWASDGPGADGADETQWLQLDLGEVGFIDSINLKWERAYSRNYEIQVLAIDDTWDTVCTFPDGKGGEVEESMLDVKARYVRILSTKGDSNYGISLFEVELFGDPDGRCETHMEELEAGGLFEHLDKFPRIPVHPVDYNDTLGSSKFTWDPAIGINGPGPSCILGSPFSAFSRPVDDGGGSDKLLIFLQGGGGK